MKQTEENAKPSSAVEDQLAIIIEVKRHGSPVEVIKIECEEDLSHRDLAPKLAKLLALEAEELIAEFNHDPGCYDPEKRRGKLQLVCVDVHFESESASHHFPARSKWAHVHRWACRKFKIAADIAANLELRAGATDGPVLNESKDIGHHEGCLVVWLVSPDRKRMGAETDRLDRDMASAEFQHGVEQGFWEFVSREGDRVFVLMHGPDGRTFLARIDCDHYWDEPIGCMFVDVINRQVRLDAWPDGDNTFEQWIKFRTNPPFICWPQDRFGIERHQEWKNLREWQNTSNPIIAYLEFLRRMLYLPRNGYSRKSAPAAS